MVWSLALEGKNDHDRLKELGWGFCTWDNLKVTRKWEWNDCDKRFGDDWPGRIPAQLIAHILRCFSNPDDLILDPMAGGGVTQDTCLAMGRRCWAFDMMDRLHDVIQIVMGWTDSHLHEFTIGKKRYTEYLEFKEDGLVCGRYRIGDLIKQKGSTFHYLYDFGDSWEHELILKESRYFNPELRTELACLEGERACPPEDAGGVPGFYEFCKALKDPNHEEHENYMEWSGGDYESEGFDAAAVDLELMKYLRWSRDRYQNWGGVEWKRIKTKKYRSPKKKRHPLSGPRLLST